MIFNKSASIARYRDSQVTNEDKDFYLNVVIPSIAGGDEFKFFGSFSKSTRLFIKKCFLSVISNKGWRREMGTMDNYVQPGQFNKIFHQEFIDKETMIEIIREYHPAFKTALALSIQKACSDTVFKDGADLDFIKKVMLLSIEDYQKLPVEFINQVAGETVFVAPLKKFHYQYGMLEGQMSEDNQM